MTAPEPTPTDALHSELPWSHTPASIKAIPRRWLDRRLDGPLAGAVSFPKAVTLHREAQR